MSKQEQRPILGRPRGGNADFKVSIRISKKHARYIKENWPTRTAAIRVGLDLLMLMNTESSSADLDGSRMDLDPLLARCLPNLFDRKD